MIPPRTVLAAVDFSDTSRAALTLAARLARQTRAALHVVHAAHPLLAAAASHEGIDLDREIRDELQLFLHETPPAERCAPGLHVSAGAAVDTVLRTAHAVGADLIVLGSRGMTGAERLVFGSTTEGVLREAAIDVLVAPAGWAPPRPDTDDLSGMGPIVAAVDLADPSTRALRDACVLATILATSVEAIHVVPSLAVLERWRAHADTARAVRVEQARQELEDRLKASPCGAVVRIAVAVGVVADRVAGAGALQPGRAPIIVLGRSRPEARRGAPGAIAYRVLSNASAPVLICAGADA
jgi:nucleotide-binding universal stress UspA family protein